MRAVRPVALQPRGLDLDPPIAAWREADMALS